MTQRPDEITAIQPNQLARPPAEMACVVIALRPQESDVLWEWVVQATYDIERRLATTAPGEVLTDDERGTLLNCLENLMLSGQACQSAATCAEIYKPHSGVEYHFISVEPQVAVSIVTMMAPSQDIPELGQLYRRVSSQIDQAFLARNEFINVPAD